MADSTSFLEMLEPLQLPDVPRHARNAAERAVSLETVTGLIATAKANADRLAQRAAAEARVLLEDAGQQAEALREAAWQEGFHDGQNTGRTALELTLRDEWEAEKQAVRSKIADMIEQLCSAREELWQAQEEEMVRFVMVIARQVIKTEVSQNPEVVAHVLQNALRRVTDKEQVRVRVSMANAPAVRLMREELVEMTDGLRHLEILDDRRIGDGGCVIETAGGTVDARIDTQLAEIERALGVYDEAITDIGSGFENAL